MTDADFKMVIECFKKRVGDRNAEPGQHMITQVAIFAKTFVNFMLVGDKDVRTKRREMIA